jgi:hypothetical protein
VSQENIDVVRAESRLDTVVVDNILGPCLLPTFIGASNADRSLCAQDP